MGVLLFFIGFFVFLRNPYLAPVIILLGLLMLSGFRGIEFDKTNRKYREYNSIFLSSSENG
jgi:hypothetical protein